MKRGFTLIELLVAMGVIGLIAAIAVPSYNIVRARADAARCVGNLRALGI
jgi:prepilin-type N-terminal cleavage/methylation domain-containing protein